MKRPKTGPAHITEPVHTTGPKQPPGLRIVGMTCAVGRDRGLAAFARRVYMRPEGDDIEACRTSLQDLILELGSSLLVQAGGETPRIGAIVLGGSADGSGDDLRLGLTRVPDGQHMTRDDLDIVDVPTLYVDRMALAPALGLAARWLREEAADVVVIGSEGPEHAAAVLLVADGHGVTSATVEACNCPGHAVILSSVESRSETVAGLAYYGGIQTGMVSCDIGLTESVAWPLEPEIVRSHRAATTIADGNGRAQLDEGSDIERDTQHLTCAVGGPGPGMPVAPLLSLIKAALCLDRRMWVPTPVLTDGDPALLWQDTPLFSISEARPWTAATGERRVVDVAYRTGDGVAHVLVTEAQPRRDSPLVRHDLRPAPTHLIPVPGDNITILMDALSDVRSALTSGVGVEAIAARQCELTAQAKEAAYVVALVARDREELLKELGHAQDGLERAVSSDKEWQTPRGSTFAAQPMGRQGVTFVYPGVFNSYPGLAGDLFQHFPWLHDTLGEITDDLGRVLAERWLYQRSRGPLTDEALIHHMALLQDQPAAMIESGATVAIAHTRIMQDVFGVAPQAALGYSMGEVSMLWATGVWRDADAGSQALHRSRLFQDMISGPKLAVKAHWGLGPGDAVDWVTYLLKAKVDRVRVAVAEERTSGGGKPRVFVTFVNLDNEVVIAGDATACQSVIDRLDCHALPVPASVAIHNEAIHMAHDDFVALYTHPVAAKPGITFYSAATYAPLRLEEAALAEAMATMCCQPVDFPRLVSRAYEDGARLFLELGPLGTCTRRIKRILKGRPHSAVAANPAPGDDWDGIIRALAVLVAHRVPVDLSPLYAGEQPTPLWLPTPQRENRDDRDTPEDRSGTPRMTQLVLEAGPLRRTASQEASLAVTTEALASDPAPIHVPPGLMQFYDRYLLPQQRQAAAVHRAFLTDREAAQSRAGAVIALQVAAGRQLLGSETSAASGLRASGSGTGHGLPSVKTAPGGHAGDLQTSAGRSVVPYLPAASRGGSRALGSRGPSFDEAALREFASGDVTRCFGPDFAVYRNRRLPRIPNGDLLLMSRVTDIRGDSTVLVGSSGSDSLATLRSEFDVAPEAWFYQTNDVGLSPATGKPAGYPGLPPYVVLMEMALQPCGFLSAYLRSPLLEVDRDLYFRNLDGHGRVLADLDLRGKTVHDDVRLLSSTRGQGVIIQTYEFSLSCEGTRFYEGWSSFGYFPLPALQRQVGLDVEGDLITLGRTSNQPMMDVVDIPLSAGRVHKQLELAAACQVHQPVDAEALPTLLVSGQVTPQDWYFQNHFHQDPVMPGSLGVEAAMQAMVQYARWRYPTLARDGVHQVRDHQMTWKYRGQITPEDSGWGEAIRLTAVRRDRSGVTLAGDVTLWKADLPIYRIEGATVRIS